MFRCFASEEKGRRKMLIDSITSDFVTEIDSLLRKQFNKQIYYPKQDDQYRLLKLKVWSERYKVSVGYILSVLIPYFEKLAYKHSRRPREKVSKGIGTTIATLTGPSAEAYLSEQILKDFKDGENALAWKEDKKEECLRILDAEEGIVKKKPKGVLAYKSIAAYRKAYMERIKHTRDEQDKLTKQLAKQPWRGNPFR
jgi:hypothetical protein